MVDSRTVELTANNNTPYTWFWLDLHDGPLVIEVPPKVLGPVDDIWYNWVGDIGFTGPDKGEGGKYLLLPPGYKGDVPQGYFVLRPGSYSVWVPWRSFLVDGDPKPGVDMVKKFTEDLSAGRRQSAEAQLRRHVGQAVQHGRAGRLSLLGAAQPGRAGRADGRRSTRRRSASGTRSASQKGKPFAPDDADEENPDRSRRGRRRDRARDHVPLAGPDGYLYPDDPNSHWRLGFIGGYKFEDERRAPARTAIPASSSTPPASRRRWTSKIVGEGSQYMAMFVDSKGDALDGGKNYKLHLPPDIPAKNFWSVIVYDNQTRSMAADGPAVPERQQPDQGLQGQRRRFGRRLFRPQGAGGQGEQLGADRSRARAGTSSCASTGRRSRGSTRPGGRARSS